MVTGFLLEVYKKLFFVFLVVVVHVFLGISLQLYCSMKETILYAYKSTSLVICPSSTYKLSNLKANEAMFVDSSPASINRSLYFIITD